MSRTVRNILRIALATVAILLIPLVAMQFTDEVAWTLSDFVIAGILLFGSGLAYELTSRRSGQAAYRAAAGVGVVAALLLLWVNGAVGIIGNENNPANLMYFGVLAIGAIGAVAARLRPRGMMYTLFAVALAQLLVPVIALVIWRPPATSMAEFWNISRVFILNGFFALLWVVSALLFRKAASSPDQGV